MLKNYNFFIILQNKMFSLLIQIKKAEIKKAQIQKLLNLKRN